jgi:hypothetical protein
MMFTPKSTCHRKYSSGSMYAQSWGDEGTSRAIGASYFEKFKSQVKILIGR